MNELNYASLEASKRLQEAGIEIETEAVHQTVCVYDCVTTTLVYKRTWIKATIPQILGLRKFPPLQWTKCGELPYGVELQKLMTNYTRDQKKNVEFESDNPR